MADRKTPAASTTPYSNLPGKAFWRSGVAEAGIFGLADLWTSKWELPADARFYTFGSCFAQHISAALASRKMNWFNAEPAPMRTPLPMARKFNYGVFSARTGNVYTAGQLRYLVGHADGSVAVDAADIWSEAEDGGGRQRDSLRPAIEPRGFANSEELLLSRAAMARAFRRAVTESDVFVFTLGLTEGWRNSRTGQPYPMCPGTLAGRFDPDLHEFDPARYPAIRADLEDAFDAMRALNPELRILLTVSPVPLTATASGDHVLKATTYSKSTLRAVAGDFAAEAEWIESFPSYEIISGAPARAMFFEPKMRSVSLHGVNYVISHFFAGLQLTKERKHTGPSDDEERERAAEEVAAAEDLICEEMTLDRHSTA
jgi:hypothetical protein